jgi:hypothetical protein
MHEPLRSIPNRKTEEEESSGELSPLLENLIRATSGRIRKLVCQRNLREVTRLEGPWLG